MGYLLKFEPSFSVVDFVSGYFASCYRLYFRYVAMIKNRKHVQGKSPFSVTNFFRQPKIFYGWHQILFFYHSVLSRADSKEESNNA